MASRFEANRFVKGVFSAVLFAGLGACAQIDVPLEERVRALADERWVRLMGGKWEGAYEMTAPSYRENTSFEKYRASAGGALTWVRAEVVSVKCEVEKCKVRLEVEVTPPKAFVYSGVLKTAVDESWVLEDGRWWIVPKF